MQLGILPSVVNLEGCLSSGAKMLTKGLGGGITQTVPMSLNDAVQLGRTCSQRELARGSHFPRVILPCGPSPTDMFEALTLLA